MNLGILFLCLFAAACHGQDYESASSLPGLGGLSKDNTISKIDPFAWLKGNGDRPAVPGFKFPPKPINFLQATDLLTSITELIQAILKSMRGLYKGVSGMGG